MVEGLDVGLDEFKRMNKSDRDSVIFQNIVHIRGNIKNDKINRRFQYFWLIGLTGVMGIKRLFGL